jgi:Protein of unknown function (DUF2934)
MMAKRNTQKSLRPAAPGAQVKAQTAHSWRRLAAGAGASTKVHGEGPSQPALDHVSHHEIAARAYELYLARGGMSGNDIGDWLQAERELCYPNSQG